MESDDTPTYNLKAVVRETGLKPDTLRAWERRYGVPFPNRTGGGHRLYSQQDIDTLKWLLARQAEGMSISRAVQLWQKLKGEGRDPLQIHPLHPFQESSLSYPAVELGDTVVQLRRAWVDACLAFDERKAEMVLNQAFAYYSPEIACFELLQKALAEIGNGWYAGAISVQQEHFASALAIRRLDSLLTATPAPTRSGRVIVGCPPGENHTFSPLLVTCLLRRRGWDVVYLGANVPTQRLQASIEQTRPNLVVFSAQLLDTAASLLDVALYLRDVDVPLAYGGYVFNLIPDLRHRIPGHFLGQELSEVPQVIEQLILNAPPMPEVEPVSETDRAAWLYFRERLGLIETQMWQSFGHLNGNADQVADINHYLSHNILSALKLGDLSLIDTNLAWVEGLLIHHGLPPRALHDFLTTYHRAAVIHLSDPAGRPVVAWLASAVAALESSVQP